MTTSDRTILRISGKDTCAFLQGLITNDLDRLNDGLLYAAILTPQGKYLADFFLKRDADDILLDVSAAQAQMLHQRLTMYKLRADVAIEATDLHLHRGLGPVPEDGAADPRHAALGWRAYRDTAPTEADIDWTKLYVTHCVPNAGTELDESSYILEMGFERLHGVDFRKGCYVGQEVTARMKHKTELRKGLARVRVSGAAIFGTPILKDGREIGKLLSRSDDEALAYLRFDRVGEGMTADAAKIEVIEPTGC
ncbi:folate-binding protein YgfZ [Shimia sp. R11_0]|uniref:CAF17-like 4Fe-4S cluster assembly/insertion protein YgfZ n=1 Tax=Shimia sp. R11_0 TaxID=2821096 RepID=UPI001ADA6802|nr:folate-binding protein YgfZ [Shimia sp. R11_0]MBO9479433.1 folate-binding protein YgfZ [Shimia sp. R11_0]